MAHTVSRKVGHLLLVAMALAMGFLSACSWVPKGDARFDVGIKDRGMASWYGSQFHGRQAANGELFDMEGLTAAHRTMPLGSIVRVVNLINGKHIHLRVTDRGPYVNGRILDLSHAAAVALGMEQEGLAIVQVEIVGERNLERLVASSIEPVGLFPLQTGMNSRSPHDVQELSRSVRSLPGDLWFSRRFHRIPSILAADHTAHTEVATLTLV